MSLHAFLDFYENTRNMEIFRRPFELKYILRVLRGFYAFYETLDCFEHIPGACMLVDSNISAIHFLNQSVT